jgi:hypothetical protein
MGDAVPSSSGFEADDPGGNGNGVSGRLDLCMPGLGAADSKEVNAGSKSMGDAVLFSPSHSSAARSGDGSGVTRSNIRTFGPPGANLTPFLGRNGGGVAKVVRGGRCWDGRAFRRSLGLINPVRLLTGL